VKPRFEIKSRKNFYIFNLVLKLENAWYLICVFHNRLVQCSKISPDSDVFAPVFGHNVHGRSIRT